MTQHNTKNKDGASPDKQQKNKKIKLLIKIYVQEVPKNIEKLLKDNKPIAVDLPYHRYEKIIETSVSKKYINKMFNDLASYMDEWDQFLADHNYYKDCNDLWIINDGSKLGNKIQHLCEVASCYQDWDYEVEFLED